MTNGQGFISVVIFVVAVIAASPIAKSSDPLVADFAPSAGLLDQIGNKVKESIRTRIQALDIPGLRLDLKGLESESTGEALGLSFDYALSKSNELNLLEIEANEWHSDWTLDFSTRGDVVFKKGANPTDFQEANAALRGYLSKGTSSFEDNVGELFEGNVLMELSRKAAECTTESIRSGTCEPYYVVKNAMEQSLGLLTTIHYGFDVAHETDQEFEATQQTIGGFVALRLFDARSDAVLGNLNVLDYPFAVLRNLTGRARCNEQELCFRPSGRSFPSIMLALDRVYPNKATARTLAGDGSEYWRVYVEASFSTPVGYVQGADVYFTTSLRLYREVNPSETVKVSGLDGSTFVSVTVGGRDGLFVSYVNGELPLGMEGSEALQLGWKLNF